jgi:hypothetical protein
LARMPDPSWSIVFHFCSIHFLLKFCSYTCQCRPTFLDDSPNRITHPGRLCIPRPTPPPEECQLTGAGCRTELNEVCRIIGGKPKCACPLNYERESGPNGPCTVIDECQFPQLNDCHPRLALALIEYFLCLFHSAECRDLPNGFTCQCRAGFKDISPSKQRPGRLCQACECPYSKMFILNHFPQL